MMNVSAADARGLSYWEYEAMLYHWNDAHKGGDDIKAPDAATTQKLIDRINSDPRLYSSGKSKKPEYRQPH